MKQFSTILNVVLVIAVAVLYYLHFWGHKCATGGPGNTTKFARDTAGGKGKTAYVDIDSIYSNVSYIKQQKDEIEIEQTKIGNDYQSAYLQLEAEKNKFLQRGKAITDQEAQQFSAILQDKQRSIENARQERGQALAAKSAKINEQLQSKLKTFLSEFNKDQRYTYIFATGSGMEYLFYKDSTRNITPEIVKGLNDWIKSTDKK